MSHTMLPQLTAVLLLLATPLVSRRGLPTGEGISKALSSFFRSFRVELPKRRSRRSEIRGGKPWWS